jgi:HEAT repeat protein
LMRVEGMLAQMGDISAAEAVTVAASTPSPRAAPAPPAAVAAPGAPSPRAAPAPPAAGNARPGVANVPRAGARGRPASCPQDDDYEVRLEALNALMQVDAERALPILRQVLQRRDECSVEMRRRAVFLIQQKRVADSDRILLDVARNDPDPDVRGQAVHWLASVNTEGAITALEEIVRSDTDMQLRQRAVFALSNHRSERAPVILRAVVEDERAPVELRQQAIFFMAQRRGADTEFLRGLYGRVQEVQLKEHLLYALSQSRSDADARWLMDIALRSNEPLELRKRALFWAAQRSVLPPAELVALYDRVTDREMKEQLIYLYTQRRTEESTTKLIEIARTERDPELRKRAIFWLGQSRDPRAAQVLQELITP